MTDAYQYCIYNKYWSFGVDILLYQLAFGVSIRIFEGIGFRLYLGPLKFYGHVRLWN